MKTNPTHQLLSGNMPLISQRAAKNRLEASLRSSQIAKGLTRTTSKDSNNLTSSERKNSSSKTLFTCDYCPKSFSEVDSHKLFNEANLSSKISYQT